jgi:hypothetical protein
VQAARSTESATPAVSRWRRRPVRGIIVQSSIGRDMGKLMLRRLFSVLVVLGLLMSPAVPPVPAGAVTININIGTNLNYGRSISCSQGERLLRARGFRDVRRVDCRGRFFVYRATRNGRRFEIAIRASTGQVVDVRRIRW